MCSRLVVDVSTTLVGSAYAGFYLEVNQSADVRAGENQVVLVHGISLSGDEYLTRRRFFMSDKLQLVVE